MASSSTTSPTTAPLSEKKPPVSISGIFKKADGITIKILDLLEGKKIVCEVLSNPSSVKLIRSIEIETSTPEDENDGDEEIDIQLVEELMGGADIEELAAGMDDDDAGSVKSMGSKDDTVEDEDDSDDEGKNGEAMNQACQPIIELLSAILTANGSLSSFSWENKPGWWDSKGRRPPFFWTALWAHSATLQTLNLGFYTHELHHVRGPSPSQLFPLLRTLYIDASTAHGDNGSAVENLLSVCPALETLEFFWPGCDLLTCQIQNISWDFHWPALRVLRLYGSDFAPLALADLLEKHPTVENFVDGVDSDFRSSFKESQSPRLKASCLPNVKAVNRADDSARFPEHWFDDEAGRKINHLGVPWGWNGGLEVSKTMARELKCLEINAGNVTNWRPDEPDSDDEEEEKKRKELDPEKKIVKSVRKILPELKGLRELGIRLESDSVTMTLPDGSHGSPPGMDEKDLKVVLSILTDQTNIRALRIWDTKGKPLPQSLLDDFPKIPPSLEYLGWEAEEKVLYRFERDGGKVKAVSCEPLRVVEEEAKKDWSEKRILDY
ncbi:hypothetical protein K505DRAFT_419092 [Melanomma pulvis-pyrius CBS 109.77]|uniref:Uncharacterized protein n=1 Tax=Melanomma pulvis-pyrius CBS 109.77 TaxID=1314802 RepID=A0A6A6X5T5_9PLEO|nr:hypothetical protein K505DRAFT_419092 [Melanomma pulvis-pyrius CBS 109.77]